MSPLARIYLALNMKAKVMARSIQGGVYGCRAEAKQEDRTEKQVAVETKIVRELASRTQQDKHTKH